MHTERGEPAASPVPGVVAVRPMEPPDVRAIARLEAECFSTPWSAATFRTLLRRSGAELWVAEQAPYGVIGYYVLWCIQEQGELANIAVDERFRGRHIGSMLLDHALTVARGRGVESVYLEVRASNEGAAAMYASRGFEQIGVRRSYYERPREDARVLAKHLGAAR
jgi:ribosomal-protein-alanine N-acetyltransferase